MTGAPDRSSTAAMLTLMLVVGINLLGVSMIIPLLPFYGKAFGAEPWQIAMVFSAYSLGSCFGEPFWGRMSDRVGRKPILISTIGACAICYFSLAFATTLEMAILIRFLGGLFGGNGSVVQSYIVDVTPPDRRAGRMGLIGAAVSAGFVVGPAVGGLLAHPELGLVGFRPPLFAGAALAAIATVMTIFLLRESRTERTSKADQPARGVVLRMAASHPVIRKVLIVTFVAGFAITGIESIFGLWTEARFGWGPREVGTCFAVVGLTAALAQGFATGRLSRRFGEANMLAAGMALMVLCCLAQPMAQSSLFIIVNMALMVLGQALAFPNVSALISRVTPSDRQGHVLGLNNSVAAAARVVGPMFAGVTFSGLSVNAPYWLSALIVLPAIWLTLSAGRSAKRLA